MDSPSPAAVIEIGSTSIRLLLVENNDAGDWRVLDQAEKPVALGRDVFTSGEVSRESFLECLLVLEGFREQLLAWGIKNDEIRIIATSAVRAARNKDIFTDRLKRETGIDIAIIEGIEETRLMYLAVRYALKNDFPKFWRFNSMILDVGGGSTEIMLLRRGKMVSARSLRLGTILIDQKARQGSRYSERYLSDNVRIAQEFLNDEMDLANIKSLVAAGSDAQQAARQIGTELNEKCRVVSRDDFINFVKSVENYSVEDCVRRLGIPFANAESFVPGLLIHQTFMERLAAEELVVPEISVREGFLLSMIRGIDRELLNDFYSQVSASALSLGRKYHFDENHGRHVTHLSLAMFDALIKEHGMGVYERRLLEAAALLHDIGMYIRSSRHQVHSQYIVTNSEIFGLKQEDLDIIGNVIRYHRDEGPSSSHFEYMALQREERIIVLKMAAILRIADALDRGHSQRIKNISIEKREETLVIRSSGIVAEQNNSSGEARIDYGDFSLEQIGLKEKADLFQDVFGYKVVLS